jgi:hypothetical protein
MAKMTFGAFFTRRNRGDFSADAYAADERPHRAGADTGSIDLQLRQLKPRPQSTLAEEFSEVFDWVVAEFREHPFNMTCFAIFIALVAVGGWLFLEHWFPTFDSSRH